MLKLSSFLFRFWPKGFAFCVLLLIAPLYSPADLCKALFLPKNNNRPKKVLIVGAGAFGLSFAQVLSNNFRHIHVFVRNESVAHQIRQGKSSSLPDVELSSNIQPTLSLEPLLVQPLDIMVLALPVGDIVHFVRENSLFLSELIKKNRGLALLSLSKGLYFEEGRLLFVEDFLLKNWPQLKKSNIYLISGPSFAREMALGEKTVVNLAGYKNLQKLKKLLSTESFKLSLSKDMRGLAFTGAVKNLLAISGGILKGLSVGPNTRSALLVALSKELVQIGIDLGADPATFLDLSYLGDILLSLDENSRNFRMGLFIGKGQNLNDYLRENTKTVEGLSTLKALYLYLKGKNFVFIENLYRILYEGAKPQILLSLIEDENSLPNRQRNPLLSVFQKTRVETNHQSHWSFAHQPFLWNTQDR